MDFFKSNECYIKINFKMSVNILNPLIPVGWSLYKSTDSNTLPSGNILLDITLQENWKKNEHKIPTSIEYLDPSNWPLTIPELSNLNAPSSQVSEEVNEWKPVITSELERINKYFERLKISRKRKDKETDHSPFSLFYEEK
jgi:hypothetical protein